MYKDDLPVKQLLDYLNSYIGDLPYFISGSYANPRIDRFSDIDIFFASKADYTAALNNLSQTDKFNSLASKHATTIHALIKGKYVNIQLIKKHFGTPEEVFKNFDLNICKHAILPNGAKVSHVSANHSMRIDKIDYLTFDRVLKYLTYFGRHEEYPSYKVKYTRQDLKYLRTLVDTYIDNSELLDNYYEETLKPDPANKIMFREFSNLPQIRDYLYKKALQHSPELLL